MARQAFVLSTVIGGEKRMAHFSGCMHTYIYVLYIYAQGSDTIIRTYLQCVEMCDGDASDGMLGTFPRIRLCQTSMVFIGFVPEFDLGFQRDVEFE